MMRLLTAFLSEVVIMLTRLVTAVQARWVGCDPEAVQRVYFANHASNGDFILIWTALPPALRVNTRPVAGADYWQGGLLRRFIATRLFRSVLIDRQNMRNADRAVSDMADALGRGASLILFPEGTRNTTDQPLLPFKGGIYRLACLKPDVELVPVWLANLNRVLPKGEVIPVPLLCSVTFGEPLTLKPDETKGAFLERTRNALLTLSPDTTRNADPET